MGSSNYREYVFFYTKGTKCSALPVTGIVGGSSMPMPAFTLFLETGVW
jgi:hypothetical protein